MKTALKGITDQDHLNFSVFLIEMLRSLSVLRVNYILLQATVIPPLDIIGESTVWKRQTNEQVEDMLAGCIEQTRGLTVNEVTRRLSSAGNIIVESTGL